ncbi:hypothetical protein MIR68_003573 [Amoeboaphelidium protococcarum]|nr:hypothetical protein MIR68_003573 [Amoeboaphelidium protococcarum]
MPFKIISSFHSGQTQIVKLQVKGKRVPSRLSQRRIEGRRLSFCESSDPQDIINYAIESGSQIINLNGLELEQLPDDLASLNCLISYCPNHSFTPKIQLDLSWNKLNILNSSSVLWTISNLVYLDLSNNGLTYLPEEIAMLSKLQTLVVRCNELQYLPVEMRDMKSLQRVNWFPNPLLQAECILLTGAHVPSLQELCRRSILQYGTVAHKGRQPSGCRTCTGCKSLFCESQLEKVEIMEFQVQSLPFKVQYCKISCEDRKQ